jgi:hypothetical protein
MVRLLLLPSRPAKRVLEFVQLEFVPVTRTLLLEELVV